MRTTLSRTQTIALSEGWNWISFNVSPPVGKNVFMDTDLFTPDDMFKCAGGTSIYKGNGEWTSVDTFVPTKNNVYEVYVKNPGKLSVDGSVLSDEELEITLDFGNKSWAEMAYLLDVTLPVNVALADFPIGAKAPVGTMIKSYNEFAVARADGQWVGSLQHMRPGIGYYVNCNGDKTTKTIRYIRSANARTRNKIKAVLDSEEDLNKYEVSSVQFESMMPVIATFKDGDVCAGDILVAYSNGQVVGVAEPGVTTNGVRDSEYDSVFFMSVHAADGDKIDFVKYRDGEAVAATKKKIAFSATGVVGTLDSPYLIDFSETSSGRIYDLSGRRYSSLPSNNGVYIIGNKKISIKK